MTDLEALQAALAAEHAIIYGYGVAGARLTGKAEALATASIRVQRERRDTLSGLVTAAGATPVAAAPAYRTPFPVTGATTARRLAAALETGGTGAAWDLVAASAPDSPARRLAVAWLSDAAVRIARWGEPVPPLPGQPT
jgi:hypothetical protein